MNEREKRDAREALYGDLANNRTTPNEAEDKARALGLEPLTPALDTARFDPMRETHWTLAMVVSWIAWADLERVRDCLPRWRQQHQSWFWRECIEGDGAGGVRERRGWLLEQTHKGEAPLLFLSICEAVEASEGAPSNAAQRFALNEANRLLWEKLAAGELKATTIFQAAPHVIPSHEWAFLRSGEHRYRDALYLDPDSWNGPRYVSDVLLPRDDVLRLWPATPAKRRGRRPGVGAKAETQIKAMRNEGVNVDAMGEKKLARALGARGVKISPRQAGRKKKGA
jgi:hypothetical protein